MKKVWEKVEMVVTVGEKGTEIGWDFREWELTLFNPFDGTTATVTTRGGLGWKPGTAEAFLKSVVEDIETTTMRELIDYYGNSWERAESIMHRVDTNKAELDKVFTAGEYKLLVRQLLD